ncbi:TetR/AcrR family transcriptional regulator [Actinopolyspora erythraea]|uniref:TetR family transcriptional regulator n=1 Tax=Actinopolyspora erythraea TaxID=414996 RepID=A0A099D7V0_9ACTN|nr:TetR/AcrR family transcriptional regulator C-terminal domain-containing protein [Actinopolyspora erythraea]ASU80038.1 TetR/AcrR family transcriptional regulator [Actinopolyspora erythraea]KGI82233.1 TetR family transcriptional regulator [Actinopolyspora erythraea]
MTIRRGSSGNPERTLELLWRTSATPTRHGPPQGLTIEAVVDTATEIADTEGIDAVTMRNVGRKLGTAPMTLYTYVPGKAELLDLMLDAGYARMSRSEPAGSDWRSRLEAVAHENRALLRTHPWMGEISTNRPILGPGALGKYEYELRALEGTGLDDVDMDAALTQLLEFVRSSVRAEIDTSEYLRRSGMDDRQWWERAGSALSSLIDEHEYPLASRVGTAVGTSQGTAYAPEHAYRFGLARLLDGFAALVAEGAGRSGE